MAERYFVQSDCVELPVHDGPGLFIAGNESTEWSSAEEGPIEEAAMNQRDNDQLLAISIVHNRPSNMMDGLAMTFSSHLRNTRSTRNGVITPACVTSITPPLPPRNCVRISHLVTAAFSPVFGDAIIWELQTVGQAEEWLGAPLTGQEFVENNLERIKKLRQEIRNGKIATTEPEKELKYNLTKDRYLSVLFVYQHLDLFKQIFNEAETE